ncbi:hypothetical protein OIU78_005720 [Salix suchowensis]|nr:hypothetical protein OIU78_005720 [Salix suchowensis]
MCQFLTLICSFRHPWLRRVSALILLNHRKLSRSESEAHQEPFEAACKTFRFSDSENSSELQSFLVTFHPTLCGGPLSSSYLHTYNIRILR